MDQTTLHPHWSAMSPFVILLAMIALAPRRFADWWGRHYPKVSFALAAVVILYYCFGLDAAPKVLHPGKEYFSFIAISIGSVFFGANTCIGNGPNFMVKAIADHQNVHPPTFVGYVGKFTLAFMLPMLTIVWLLFFYR